MGVARELHQFLGRLLGEAGKAASEVEASLEAAMLRIEELEALVAELSEENKRLRAENQALRRENQELREKLNASSQNTSKPPSSDGPQVERKPRRKGGKRKAGGQKGHKGKARELLPVEAVNKVVKCRPKQRCGCGGKIKRNEGRPPRRHQVHELLPIKLFVTEWQSFAGECKGCGRTHWGKHPKGTPSGMLGPRLMAFMGLMVGRYHLSKRSVVQMLDDLFSLRLSLGTVSNTDERVSEALAPAVEEAKEYVRSWWLVHMDETGHKMGKARAWLWLAATSMVAVFYIRFSRGSDVAKEVLGPTFTGLLVTDRWSAYGWVDTERRQLCWAHLLRDFIRISERPERGGEIGNAILDYVQKMFHLWHQLRDGTIDRSTFQGLMAPIRDGIESLIDEGRSCGQNKTEGTAKNLFKHKAALFTFVDQMGVEPTNNYGERLIRAYVLWRKNSYATQSLRGNRFVERIMTVVVTCRLQRRDVLEYLTSAISAHLHEKPIPTLLPTAPEQG